ncbi:hypothetical protein [Streptomyces sp. ICC4]|uniref:hypothetical protein n=1 Tax=Streptomyces sp. ICC4 TaxID=2099584 RepID=UPI0013A6A1E9|nr:hypothetical protein [Streptomyces sp. ICC4]
MRWLAARTQERPVALVERAVAPGMHMDFVAALASWPPIQTTCEMAGVPQGDEPLTFEWSNRIAGRPHPDRSATPGE